MEENAKRPRPVVVVDGDVATVGRDVRQNEVPGYDRWARNVGDAQEPCGNQTSNISDQPCGAMKMAQSCKEGTAANRRRSGLEGHRLKAHSQQGHFIMESPLKSLVIFMHNIKSCVGCIA